MTDETKGPSQSIRWDGSGAFRAWFDALSPAQREWLVDKARWEQMTLSAVAKEWSVPATKDLP